MGVPPTSTTEERRSWFASPALRGLVAVICLVVLICSVYASYQYSRLLDDECAQIPREVLEIRQMGLVRTKVREWKSSPFSELVFEGKESSWVLREVFRLPIHLEINGDQVHIRLAADGKDGCYNIDYRGSLRVRDGVVFVVPVHLNVGDVDLTTWVAGRGWDLGPTWVKGKDNRDLLRAISTLDVKDGEVHITINDPSVIP